jgi:hypothetical protein
MTILEMRRLAGTLVAIQVKDSNLTLQWKRLFEKILGKDTKGCIDIFAHEN